MTVFFEQFREYFESSKEIMKEWIKKVLVITSNARYT